ncbi:thioredoxin family protein [Pilimelia columellifera]|uniref:Thioredoxin domain-containing protein n=1 Tax=Pilimelia columellifera subsp. columellifera TaxID=706583 RepID=A0ABP6A388_9ACTN
MMKRTIAMLAGALSLAGALAVAAPANAAFAPKADASVPFADPTIIDVTAANFPQVLEMSNTKPVVLDFTATWCHWCQVQYPHLKKFNEQDNGSWILAKVDVDRNKDIMRKYSVRGIPALVSIGKEKEYGSRSVGFDSANALRAWLTNVVTKYPASR